MKYQLSTSSVTRKAKLRTRWFIALAFLLFFIITGGLFAIEPYNKGGFNGGVGVASSEGIVVHADSSGDAISVKEYSVTVVVNANRTIDFHERLKVTMNQSRGTQFYRSLPIDQGDAYFNLSGKRSAEDGRVVKDSFEVNRNPDDSGYIDIICYGGIERGKTWIYDFSYSMRSSETTANGLILDVVGGGWTIPLKNVTVTVKFPAPLEQYSVYSDDFGGTGKKYINGETLSADKQTLTLTSNELPLVYNKYSNDRSAAAVTLQFALPEGAMSSYGAMLLQSPSFWIVFLLGVGAAIGAVVLSGVFKVNHDMLTVVSVKPPEGMDPLMMGRMIDGVVDTEDITSMIYYFAEEGYLTIEMPEKKNGDPILHRTAKPQPENMPSWQKTLLDGLFKKGTCTDTKISDLKYKFYAAADKAKTLISARRGAEYEKKSIFGFFLLNLVAFCMYTLIPMLIGKIRIGGGYTYYMGAVSLVPILVAAYGYFGTEQQRYKKKLSARKAATLLFTVLLVLFGVWYTALFARHILTVWEKLFIAVSATIISMVAPKCISRTGKYTETLGKILGFKDFILYTEEDKIKFMLSENPQLYFNVLPYAQVLGITKEWEDKFKSITIAPPDWCSGNSSSGAFNYVMFNSMIRTSFLVATARPKPQGGGTILGGGGGGGHFGGFSGGGHGGGGGGVR